MTAKRSAAQMKMPKLDELMAELIDEARRISAKDGGSVTLTAGGKDSNKRRGRTSFAGTCHHCDKKGHKEANCWAKHPEKAPKKPEGGGKGEKGSTPEAAVTLLAGNAGKTLTVALHA